jgi:TubC N-terminal docking domain
MNASEMLETLTKQGVRLWVDNDKLRINSPKGVLTPEIQTKLSEIKIELLSLLKINEQKSSTNVESDSQYTSLEIIGSLISGFSSKFAATEFKAPIIDPLVMAKQLKVTFKPLPNKYSNEYIIKFREELEKKLSEYGVEIETWEQATKELNYELKIPLIPWHQKIKVRIVKSEISAVVDVERHPKVINKLKIYIAEKLYQIYSKFIWKNQKQSISKIAQFISWAEENIRPVEDPTNTQIIVLTKLDPKFVDPNLPYQKKIPIGVNTLVRTFSEIVVGVSPTNISILNMNLSDSMFPVKGIDDFVLKSLIPKIYVPILPLSISRFEVSQYDPSQSQNAIQLVKLGRELASTELLPSGFKIDDVIKRKSHRDIVDCMANGRTGVSYGFVAYAEPPEYIGPVTISTHEWENLSPIEKLNSDEIRQNKIGRRYLKTKIGQEYKFKQIPDIWVLSSRSGSNKTNLNLETDILRIGLQDRLLLQLPKNIDSTAGDTRPSYDIYVMLGIALAASLYAPELIAKGMPMVHFHGYPSINWFATHNEYCTGVFNPSVPCGTYESGVFNFLGIQDLVNLHGDNINLASLIEPDHGTNIIARDIEYLITRIKAGVEQGQIELGGKYFSSLKGNG